MIAWTLVDTADIPGGATLQLFRHDKDFSIRVAGSGVLMNTRGHGSEDALAELACAKIATRSRPRVLIGGLGMGFTLATALRCLPSGADVVVAELLTAVIAWNRGALGEYAGHPLRDRRSTVYEGDIIEILKSDCRPYDAIVLDVDNGPDAFTRKENEWLYTSSGLAAAYQALRPNGVLAVWSAAADPSFTARLQKAGFQTEQLRPRARRGKGARQIVWIAERGV